MTFKETDFPGLFKFLKLYVTEESDPVLVKEVVLQIIKLYESVPLYPGIVEMCIGGYVKTIDPKEIVVGQKLYIQNGKDYHFGTVTNKDAGGIKLKMTQSVASASELTLKFEQIGKVKVVDENILEKMWPSLIFNKDKK